MRMRRSGGALTCLAALALALGGAGPLRASTAPNSAALGPDQPTVQWQGGPFQASAVRSCGDPQIDGCHRFRLSVDGDAGDRLVVDIRSARSADPAQLVRPPLDDFDVELVDSSGAVVDSADHDLDAPERVHVVLPTDAPASYTVRVRPELVTPGASYLGSASLSAGGGAGVDEEVDCQEPVPSDVAVPVLDDGRRVALDLEVLLDGVTYERGVQIVDQARAAYGPVGVDLVGHGYSAVSLSGTSAQGLIDQARARFGGTRPAGRDVVVVLTSKDVELAGQRAITGQADCIGGVRFAHRAFMVAETVFPLEGMRLPSASNGPVTIYHQVAAKTFGHELAHLLGAHHHHADCAQGAGAEVHVGGPGTCTLTFQAIDLVALRFGALEAAIVRGHALAHASP